MDLRVRAATPDDLEALRDVYRRSSLSNAGDRAPLLAHPDALEYSGAAVGEGRTQVAHLADGGIIGFVSTEVGPDAVELEDLFVDPDWRRRGVGRQLVSEAEGIAREHGVTRVEVTANGHALAFYRSLGFKGDGPVETRFGIGHRMHLDVEASRSRAQR